MPRNTQIVNAHDIIASGEGSTVKINQTNNLAERPEVQAVLHELQKLREEVLTSGKLDEVDKPIVAATIQTAETLVSAPKPNRDSVVKAVSMVQSMLKGVESLAPAAIRIAELVAKNWPM